jgi:GNAT superfamily N-acetyltransferase
MATIVDVPPPGALGTLVGLHGDWYARHWELGLSFEARVAAGLGEFALTLPDPDNRIFVALDGATVVGGVVIDGRERPHARLRWFIVAEGARGGLGRRLLGAALEFCAARGFAEVWLLTFAGLDAARRLYEAHGFVLEHQAAGSTWGVELTEQRFRLRLG